MLKTTTELEREAKWQKHLELQEKIKAKAESLGCTYQGNKSLGSCQIQTTETGGYRYYIRYTDWNDEDLIEKESKEYKSKTACLKAAFKEIAAIHKRYESDMKYWRHEEAVEEIRAKMM